MRSTWVFVLVATTLSGCFSDDGPGLPQAAVDAGTLTDAGLVLPWGLKDCDFVAAELPATAAAIAPYLPEGFRSLSMEEIVGTGTDVAGEANFGVEMFRCASGATFDGEQQDLIYASYFTAVEPPEGLKEDVGLHFVKWDTLIPDDDRRELLQEIGIPAVTGDVAWTLHEGGQSVWAYEGELQMDGAGFTFVGTSLAPSDSPLTFVEFQETDRGLVTWHASIDATQVGLGPVVVAVPSSGLASTILGQPVAIGAAFGGVTTLSEANITIPA